MNGDQYLNINIYWNEPRSVKEIITEKLYINDVGLYQVYGTHPIYGRNVLLYIGLTNDSIFHRMLNHHKEWMKYEYDDLQIYYGEIVSENVVTNKEIEVSEKMLIYFCAPAYNSNELLGKSLEVKEKITVRNFGKIGSLPTEVSTIWYNSEIWINEKYFK